MCREMTVFTSSVYLTGRFKDIFKFRDCNAIAEKVNQLDLELQNLVQLLKRQSIKAKLKLRVSTDFKACLKAAPALCMPAVKVTVSVPSLTFRNIWCLPLAAEDFSV